MRVLASLGYLYLFRYQVLPEGQDQDELRKALGFFSVLAGLAPQLVPDELLELFPETREDSAGDPGRLAAAGAAAFDEYHQNGRPEALNAAVTAFQDAVAVTAPGDPNLAALLSSLGTCQRARFEEVGDGADLDAAIEAGQQAVDLTPSGDPHLAPILSSLGGSLATRFRRAGDDADLDAAIEAGQRAADLTPAGDPDLPGILSNLGATLHSRFGRTGDVADLDAAIEAGRQAVDLTPAGDPDLAGILSNLGLALRSRFGRAGDDADLDAAIEAGQRAADLTPAGDPDLAGILSNLGATLRIRFGRSGDTVDLDAAIEAGRQAADLIPPGHLYLAAVLSDLGNSLATRFGRSGDAADLDAAIDAGRQAVDLIPPGHQALDEILSDLASSLHARFRLSGDAADLDAAIDIGRRAADIPLPGDPNLAGVLSALGVCLLARFERSGDPADLDAAVDVSRRAADLVPPGHQNLAGILSNLGAALHSRFGQAGDAADLDAAVDVGWQAADLIPHGHPDRAAILSGLGVSLRARFEQAGNLRDLDAAVNAARQAADLIPHGHPERAGILSGLGVSLRARFRQAGNLADLDAAIECWRQASAMPTAIPSVRITAATGWGAAAADAKRASDAAEGFAVAVELLPAVAWHGLNRATREGQLAEWAGLACDAAASAILDDRPGLAVELLEQGRSVLWTQALKLRSDLSRLSEKAPGLAERLDSIRAILDSPVPEVTRFPSGRATDSSPAPGGDRSQHDVAELRRRMAREWDEVLAQVRAIDGFEHFLAAVPYQELKAAASSGPVVIVNVSRYGCHALIVDADSEQPRVVNLPDLTLRTAVDHAYEMLQALAGDADPQRAFLNRENDRHAVLDVLDWLWDVIAEPVLTTLGHTSTREIGSPWPRVWWCPTGPLVVLPIHAAGYHPRLNAAVSDSARCLPDRMISSYTPTLAALARALQPASPTQVRQLTVGMPDTPGLPPLPAVPYELKVLASHFPPGTDHLQLTGPQATRANAMTAIGTHSWIHLACHASQQHSDPASSGFALRDGTLTISDLAAQPTQHRDLAFLSACQTAAGSVRHLDEAIHLAAAMQFLGYRHVIATMWTIADSPAPHVASMFYTTLKRDGQPDQGRTAEALHHAVRSLRQAHPANPVVWAPYIHIGS